LDVDQRQQREKIRPDRFQLVACSLGQSIFSDKKVVFAP